MTAIVMESRKKASKPTSSAKGSKKGWRKIKIEDVEDFLEEERIQERTGGLASEKPDDQLFVLDTGLESNQVSVTKPQKLVNRNPDRQLRSQRILEKPLKKHAVLSLNSHIKPAIKFGTPKAPPPPDTLPYSEEKKLKRKLKGRGQKELLARRTETQQNKVYDIWAEEEKGVSNAHFDLITKRTRVKPPGTLYRKPSLVASVPAPHSGLSYNPTFEDHQTLLQEATSAEVLSIAKERNLRKKLKPNFGPEGRPTQETYWKDMSAGLFDVEVDDEQDVEENISGDGDKRRKHGKRKGNREKRHDIRMKEKKRVLKKKSVEKKLLASYRQITVINKDVISKEQAHEVQLAKKTEERKHYLLYGTKRLGKLKFQELEPQVALTNELRGSMRKIAPTFTTLLDERLNSLQMRNMIEPRQRRKIKRTKSMKKQYKVKRTHRKFEV